jgi:hypothetical protein
VAADGFGEKAQGGVPMSVLGEEEVNRLTGLIHRAIQIAPLAFHPDVGLIQPLTDPHGALTAVERRFELWGILQDPAVDGRMIDGHAALFHQLLHLAVA